MPRSNGAKHLPTTHGGTGVTVDVVVRDSIGNSPKHQIPKWDVTAEFSWWRVVVRSSQRAAKPKENHPFFYD